MQSQKATRPEKFRKRFVRRFEGYRLGRLTSYPRPKSPRATIIFAGLSEKKFATGGKVTAFEFLPAFANQLREIGFDTTYVTSHKALKSMIDSCEKAIVVMIYKEVGSIPNDPGLEDTLSRAALVMHHPKIGQIICDKRESNIFLSKHGVPIPELADGSLASEHVFSNDNNDSGAAVYTVAPGATLDSSRYNARFIDTRVRHGDKEYYTTARLMCVGPTITHTLMRARPVSEGSASVHSKNTPVDKELLLALHARLVVPNADRHAKLARMVYDAIGPGFYAHDILLDTSTDEIFMAETGFKFDDLTYGNVISPIQDDLHFLDGFHTPGDIARQSVDPFVALLAKEDLEI